MSAADASRGGLRGTRTSVDELIGLRFRAQRLDLGAARRPRHSFAGAQLSRFRGRGMEFAESRVYQPGDDVRSIDWRVTARTGKPHTKLFQEERERPVFLVVDLGASMLFGTRVAFKSVVAAEAAALVAWAAMRHGDRVGALVVAADGHRELKPVAGRRGVLRVLRALAALSGPPGSVARSDEEHLAETLLRARHVARPGSLIFVLSDFYALTSEALRHLSRLRQHNDMLACWVHDVLERRVPPPGRYPVSDGEHTAVLDTMRARSRERYHRHFEELRRRLLAELGRLAVPVLPLVTGGDVAQALQRGLGGHSQSVGAASP